MKRKSLQGNTYRRHSRWDETGASFNTDPSSDERQMHLNIVKRDRTSRNITARVIERHTSGEIYYFLEGSELANMVTNDAQLSSKNDANLALPPRFRQVLIESPL
ncbi:hypothetical protein TNCV_3007501 [Trichonephila clavipes]|nr:hypothetical protein TNCV_3007501 [Trichonephila clavipes]